MARRAAKRRNRRPLWIVVGFVVAVVIVAILSRNGDWQGIAGRFGHLFSRSAGAPVVSAESIDPANDGKRITVRGQLRIATPPRDPRLGISANVAVLFRHVEMYQWRERCSAGNCIYDTDWSQRPIDSRKFDRPDGHENPPFPFTDAQFPASDIRLGAFRVDPALIAARGNVEPLALSASSLPPNLAATFRDVDGSLYAGDDPTHPAIGDLRVTFLDVGIGKATLSGIQRGSRLTD